MSFIDSIEQLDTDLFLYLNSKHTPFMDSLMFWVSHKYFWIPLYIVFLLMVWKYFGKKTWLIALCVVLLVVLSDQISVHAFKNVFQRYRPCHNLAICDQVFVNDGKGGMYGFVSSHAANTFALAMFLWLLFKDRIRYFGAAVFLWASFVSYSRIYNGVHYPLDIAGGAILGMGVGIVVYKIFEWTDRKFFGEKLRNT